MECSLSQGTCRCCLTEGQHANLYQEYNQNGQHEVFAQIFMECFNITLPRNIGLPSHICSVCIQKLYDAQSFRTQVLDTQKLLLNESNDNKNIEFHSVADIKDPLGYYGPDLKCEVKVELHSDNEIHNNDNNLHNRYEKDEFFSGENENLPEENYSDSDEYLSNLKSKKMQTKKKKSKKGFNKLKKSKKKVSVNLVPGEKELLKRFLPSKLCMDKHFKPLPTRDSLMDLCPIFYGYLERLKGKIIKASMITLNEETTENLTKSEAKVAKYRKPCESINDVLVTDKMAAALNAATLLENSNATVFKTKMRTGFPCFYCRHVFTNPMDLRSHQMRHQKNLIYKLLMKYPVDELVVYAEITDLKCSLCDLTCDSLESLKEHLVSVHGKKMYDVQSRVVPFILGTKETNFECHICGQLLETFRTYEQHIQNAHYRNFVCEICNVGFVTRHRLKYHNYMLHNERQIKTCEICKKVFLHKHKYKTHFDSVHKKLLKVKCPKCPERFSHFYARQRHMEAVHGVELLLYKCTECDKTFNRKAGLNMHFKRVHSGNRDVQCELCSFMCFTSTELKQHHHHHHPQSSLLQDWGTATLM